MGRGHLSFSGSKEVAVVSDKGGRGGSFPGSCSSNLSIPMHLLVLSDLLERLPGS